jgi:chromosome segregation ATPase
MRHALLILPLLLVACGNEEEIKKKVAAVQQQADDQAAKAKQLAQQKLDELQKQLDQLKTDVSDAKAKLDECTSKAQASADDLGKTTEAALAAARQAFKSAAKLELTDANKAINDLAPKSAKATAKAKAAFQKALQPVAGQQKTIAADLNAFDSATLDTFKTVKTKFEHDLALLKNTTRVARSKLPP